MKRNIILLAGSGHAHLETILNLTFKDVAENKYILLSPRRQTFYSGLIPRYISGELSDQSLTIDSADFAQRRGLEFIQDSIDSVDETNQIVTLKSGQSLKYDVLSLNVGGTTVNIPTECPDRTIYLRPFENFVEKWQDVLKKLPEYDTPRFLVVGGGAAAVEIAAALKTKLNQYKKEHRGEVHLISRSKRLCPNYSEGISFAIHQSLVDLNVILHFNEPIRQIGFQKIFLKNGDTLCFDFIFIVTPTQPSKIILRKTDEMLRLSDRIFAVGDGAEINMTTQLPRSGVIAVHQGRHLIHNIRNTLNGHSLMTFSAPTKQLNILILGQSKAILIWGRIRIIGHWALKIKNWIDVRYMKKFI